MRKIDLHSISNPEAIGEMFRRILPLAEVHDLWRTVVFALSSSTIMKSKLSLSKKTWPKISNHNGNKLILNDIVLLGIFKNTLLLFSQNWKECEQPPKQCCQHLVVVVHAIEILTDLESKSYRNELYLLVLMLFGKQCNY